MIRWTSFSGRLKRGHLLAKHALCIGEKQKDMKMCFRPCKNFRAKMKMCFHKLRRISQQ